MVRNDAAGKQGSAHAHGRHLRLQPPDDAFLDIERQLQVVERLRLELDVLQCDAALPCCRSTAVPCQ